MPPYLRLCAVLLLPCCLLAADQQLVDADLPQPFEFDQKLLSDMRTHSPFNRFVSLEDTIQLTGVAYIDGKPMATLVNKDTKQRFVVSEEPNALGWTLSEATLSDEPSKTEVHLMIGVDEVVLHYSEAQLRPDTSRSSKPELATKKQSSTRSHGDSGSEIDVASLLGDRGKELYLALSPQGREKLAIVLQASQSKHPERPTQDNAALAQKMYAKILSAENKAQASNSSKTPRPPKPKKK